MCFLYHFLEIDLKGTLIDTTSLIALAIEDYHDIEPFVLSKNQLSGIEAVLLSEKIIIDYPSYKKNVMLFPELKKLENLAMFINCGPHDEDNCYHKCVEVLSPILINITIF